MTTKTAPTTTNVYPAWLPEREVEILKSAYVGSQISVYEMGLAKVTGTNPSMGSVDVEFEDGRQLPMIMPIQIEKVYGDQAPGRDAPEIVDVIERETLDLPSTKTDEKQEAEEKQEPAKAKKSSRSVAKPATIPQLMMIASEMLRIKPTDGDWEAWMKTSINLQRKMSNSWEASEFIDWLKERSTTLKESELLAHKKIKAFAWYKLQEQGLGPDEASEKLQGPLTRGEVRELIEEKVE